MTWGVSREVAVRWMDEVWGRRDLSSFDDLHAPDFVDHSPSGRNPDRASYRSGIIDLFSAFPDFAATIEDLIVDEPAGKAAIRWAASGTHRGPFLDVAPTGHRVEFRGIEIIRVEAGRIAERWGEWDEPVLLRSSS